jgi:hypothetical protein
VEVLYSVGVVGRGSTVGSVDRDEGRGHLTFW